MQFKLQIHRNALDTFISASIWSTIKRTQSLAFKRQNLLAYASNNCSIKPAIPKHGPCGSTDTFLLPLSNPWSSKRLGLTLTDTRGSRNLAGYHRKRDRTGWHPHRMVALSLLNKHRQGLQRQMNSIWHPQPFSWLARKHRSPCGTLHI